MPGVHHPPADQAPTYVSLADLAVTPQIFQLTASSQGLTVDASLNLETVGFLLATRQDVEAPDLDQDIALFLNATGRDTKPFRYGMDRPQFRVSVMHAQSRDSQLAHVFPQVITALSQGRWVCIHCNQSFHRGPILFAAVCRGLFGVLVPHAMKTLAKTRLIYDQHLRPKPPNSDLGWALQWAAQLSCAQVRQALADAASSQAAASQAAASSSGQQQRWVPKASPAPPPASSQGRYLYRAMTPCLTEFKEKVSPPALRGVELARAVLRAVDEGSSFESQWLHASQTFNDARLWRQMGRAERGAMDTLMCRLDVVALREWAASSQGPHATREVNFEQGMFTGQTLDMSTNNALKFFRAYSDDDGVHDRIASALRKAKSSKEVLVAWRGFVPKRFFDVVHPETGVVLRPLDPDPCTLR